MFRNLKPENKIGSVQAQGIQDSRRLPDESFSECWEAIILDPAIKNRLLGQALLNFTLRSKVDRARLPLHGILLLVGKPGTGKTSLARGLASKTAEVISHPKGMLYLEVEPHSLTGAALGKSQKAVTELLGGTIAEHAALGPLVVLLDEVETLAPDRSKLSLEANPVDVHRATDAVLTQLDQLADRYPNILFIATSNFPQAIDPAFFSRADLVETVDLPGLEACRLILADTLKALAEEFPDTKRLLSDKELDRVAKECVGLDGRRIRKIVAMACTFDKETALDPNRLTTKDLVRAAEFAMREDKAMKGGGR